MNETNDRIVFRGGPAMSVLPLAIFIAATTVLVIKGAPAVEGMIIAAMVGISAGMLFTTNITEYSERVFTLMANRTATVAVVCWLWAGAFSGILANSGLVEAIVWVGWKLQLTGALFTLAVFVSSALFATAVGTGARHHCGLYRGHVSSRHRAGRERACFDGSHLQRGGLRGQSGAYL